MRPTSREVTDFLRDVASPTPPSEEAPDGDTALQQLQAPTCSAEEPHELEASVDDHEKEQAMKFGGTAGPSVDAQASDDVDASQFVAQ